MKEYQRKVSRLWGIFLGLLLWPGSAHASGFTDVETVVGVLMVLICFMGMTLFLVVRSLKQQALGDSIPSAGRRGLALLFGMAGIANVSLALFGAIYCLIMEWMPYLLLAASGVGASLMALMVVRGVLLRESTLREQVVLAE